MAKQWTPAQMPSQAGKRFLITGANSGIGYSAAVELARHGAQVVLLCRDRARGEEALRRLRVEATGKESAASIAELALLDLASLVSVRAFAEQECARGEAVHGLINNAGLASPPKRRETQDGFEIQFGTNVLGHFALTCRLLPALERTFASSVADPPRVVTVSSVMHKLGKINFEDLQARRRYSPVGTYAQSKLGDLMFTFELERRLRAASKSAISIAAHPGVASSNITKIGQGRGLARQAEKGVTAAVGIFFNSQEQGALPTVFAATAPEAKGGGYYGPQGFQELRGGDVGPAKVAKQALDEAAQRRLWDVCAELTGCTI